MKIHISTKDPKTDAATKEIIDRAYLPDSASLSVISEDEFPAAGVSNVITLYKDDAFLNSDRFSELSELYKENYKAIKYPYDIREFMKSCRSLVCANADCDEKSRPSNDISKIALDDKARTITYEDKSVKLAPTEFKLFKALYNSAGKVVSRDFLLKSVWNSSKSENILDVYITYLRKKISPIFGDGALTSVRNKGYILIIQ